MPYVTGLYYAFLLFQENFRFLFQYVYIISITEISLRVSVLEHEHFTQTRV